MKNLTKKLLPYVGVKKSEKKGMLCCLGKIEELLKKNPERGYPLLKKVCDIVLSRPYVEEVRGEITRILVENFDGIKNYLPEIEGENELNKQKYIKSLEEKDETIEDSYEVF